MVYILKDFRLPLFRDKGVTPSELRVDAKSTLVSQKLLSSNFELLNYDSHILY